MWGLNYSVLVRYLRCLNVPTYVIWVVESATICNIRLWCSRAPACLCQVSKNWWSPFIAMRMSVWVHVRYHICQESHHFSLRWLSVKNAGKKSNVLVTYLRYLRVPKYEISVLIRLVISFLILNSFRVSETHFETGDPMCIGMLNRELPDEGDWAFHVENIGTLPMVKQHQLHCIT